MGGKRLARCTLHRHDWQPMKRGGAHEQCTKCHDVFPCRHDCEHLDCIVATGRALTPYFMNVLGDPVAAVAAIRAELSLVAPTVYAALIKHTRKAA